MPLWRVRLVDNVSCPYAPFSLSPLHSDPEPALNFRTAAPKPQTQTSNFLPSSPYRPSGVADSRPRPPHLPPLVALPCAAGPSTPHSSPFTEVSSEAESHAELTIANMMASLEGSGSVLSFLVHGPKRACGDVYPLLCALHAVCAELFPPCRRTGPTGPARTSFCLLCLC